MKKPRVKAIQLLGNEERILSEQMLAVNQAQENLNRSATMVLAREGISFALLQAIKDGKMIVTLPSG